MSLEQALAENTAAIRELIAVMRPRASVAAPVVTYHVESTKDDVSTIIARVDGSPNPEEKAAPEAPSKPPEAVVEAPAAIEYAQVAQAIIETFKVDRAKVVATLGKFGAKKGPELKVADYAAFLAELA